MVARLLALLVLLLPFPAFAQDGGGSSLAGSWALQIGPATIFRFDIAPVEGKEGEWKGTWSRPQSFATDGDRFSKFVLPAKVTPSMTGIEFEGQVELSFNDPRPGAVPDIFDFKLIDPDAAEMKYLGTDLAPYMLFRVKPGTPLGPFQPNAVYSRAPKVEAEPGTGLELDSEKAEPPVSELPDLPPIDAQGFRLPPKGTPTR